MDLASKEPRHWGSVIMCVHVIVAGAAGSDEEIPAGSLSTTKSAVFEPNRSYLTPSGG